MTSGVMMMHEVVAEPAQPTAAAHHLQHQQQVDRCRTCARPPAPNLVEGGVRWIPPGLQKKKVPSVDEDGSRKGPDTSLVLPTYSY
jgi:hypothetical protein